LATIANPLLPDFSALPIGVKQAMVGATNLQGGPMRSGLDRLIAGLGRLNDVVCWLGKHLSWVLVAAMTAVVLAQVVARYIFNNPLAWTEEAAIFAMIWMTFLVAPIAYRTGGNVAIDVIRDLFKGRWQAVVQIVLNLLVVLLLIVLLRQSILYVGRGMGSVVASLGIRSAWLYIIMPIGVAGMLLVGIEIVLRAVRGLIDPSQPILEPLEADEPGAREYE
jgi:TRAP-type C4-dicarboxylate transport system permease small subunit